MKSDKPMKLDGLITAVAKLDTAPREIDFGAALNAHTIGDGSGNLIPGLPPEYANRKPLKFEGRFLWHPESEKVSSVKGYYSDHLPPEVFLKLSGQIPRDNPRVHLMVKAYTSEAAAMQALRDAVALLGEK